MSLLPSPGTGYYVAPAQGPGPGVLLVPSAWGLTPSLKRRADELAEAGFSVLAPDLNDGQAAATEPEAMSALMSMDLNVAASLLQSSLRLLRGATVDPKAAMGVVGFGSGGSWALWLSERCAADCVAAVSYYGTQSIRFDESVSSYLLHFAAEDQVVTADEVAMLGLDLKMTDLDFRLELHPGVGHGFAEAEHANFNAETDAVAWRQTLEFLAAKLRPYR